MTINRQEYRSSVLGCWLGKNIGGTLGAPFEWRRQVNDVSFYTQDLGGEPLPNDDLDIQLLWLVALEEQGIEIDAHVLAEYWLLYVTPHWCEYGNAKINMRAGLMPPLSGTEHNLYKHSCGAFIRSEIWACIAPGQPRIAARYAYEDAILDHGDGEGTHAAVFCAALESAAFVEKDIRKLLDIGLSYVPDDCGVARAVRCAMDCYDSGMNWRDARDTVLRDYRGGTAMTFVWCTSEEDREKGFHEGVTGWDAPSNIAIIVLGLLYGEGRFDESLCITVNCGEDTDCTGATVGSIFGILHGAESIPQRWIDPIGRTIRVACLNLGELGYFGNQLPQNVDDLTDRTERVAAQVLLRHGSPVVIWSDGPTDLAGLSPDSLLGRDFREALYRTPCGTVHRFRFFDVAVDYGDSPRVMSGCPKTISLTVTNNYKIAATLDVRWYVPEGWSVLPSRESTLHVKQAPFGKTTTASFTVQAERVPPGPSRMVVELTMAGRPMVMLVPVVLTNGDLG